MDSSFQTGANPLLLPEIVDLVLDHVDLGPDLLSCACVNSLWSILALRKLYQGSLTDIRDRTPDIGSLNCLFIASRERFARNMGFVKHLLLSSDTPLPYKYEGWSDGRLRLVCAEKIRALRNRQDAELLLRPQGRGIISLIMPFQIPGQEWSHISDLLLSPTVQFLAIDNLYCYDFSASTQAVGQPAKSLDSVPLRNRFTNLKALTVYKSEGHQHISTLLKLLMCCDLEFFHLEDHCRQQLSPEVIARLLGCLELQSNLKTLALRIRTPVMIIGKKNHSRTWPRLKALYLWAGDETWLEQFSNFEGLEALSLHGMGLSFIEIDDVTAAITKCRNLRSIDIDFHEGECTQLLLGIAHSCPYLRNLRAQSADTGIEPPDEEDFLDLTRSLPHLEFLELDWSMLIEGDTLRDLAVYCPKLTVLKVPKIGLLISLEELKQVYSLQCLEMMQVHTVLFRDSRHLMEPENFPILTSEWRRVFPKLRAMPCPEDIPNLHIEKKEPSDLCEPTLSEDGEEMSADEFEEQDEEQDEEGDAEQYSD